MRVLSRRFRETFLRRIDEEHRRDQLSFSRSTESIAADWTGFIRSLREHEWVVYAKPPFGGAEQVLKYLARYTHRVAISNSRLVAIEGDRVRFRWKDYRSSRQRTLSLTGAEFVRRFLMHILPRGFQRIRHYGHLANCGRREKLERIRTLLAGPAMPDVIVQRLAAHGSTRVAIEIDDPDRAPICPCCKKGRLRVIEILLPEPVPFEPG